MGFLTHLQAGISEGYLRKKSCFSNVFLSFFFYFHLENIQLLHFQTSFIHQGRRLVWAACFKSLRWPAAVLILELESLCLLWSWSQLSQSLWSTKVKSRWQYRLVLEQCQSFKPPPKVRFHSSEEELEELWCKKTQKTLWLLSVFSDAEFPLLLFRLQPLVELRYDVFLDSVIFLIN